MRRLSALMALMALTRLSLIGGAVDCVAHSATTEQHRHSSATTDGATAHEHDIVDATSDEADCGTAQFDGCLSMSSCASAIPADVRVHASDASTVQRVGVGVSSRAFELPRGPEPPPPRT